ncbi:MAG: transglycosylase SLT domain-containing protein, partial [Gammaproteobacteria bacterium]|nr:transglycosylase SLT domain-containing protein [Gammaproteobacteria bacterium]
MPNTMSWIQTGLLQRIYRASGIGVTFFVVLTGCSSLPPVTAETSAPTAAPPQPELIAALSLDLDRRTPVALAPPDLLQRLRSGFSLATEDNRRIDAERDWFAKHPDYLLRVFTRAQRYLPYISAELDRRGLPLELALLPIVESAYDPFAYSHGRAAGLWQMIPGTA